MAYSVVTYTGDGSTDEFSVTFPYLKGAHVKVYLDDVLQTDPTNYSLDTSTNKVTFVTAPVTDAEVKIQRETDRDEDNRPVIFTDGGRLDAEDLNDSDLYIIYLVQEALDQISGDAGDDLSAQLATKADQNGANISDPAAFRTNITVYSQTEVLNQIAAGALAVRRVTDSTTLVEGSDNVLIIDGTGKTSDVEITFPSGPANGTIMTLKNVGSPDPGSFIVAVAGSGDTLEQAGNVLTTGNSSKTWIYEAAESHWHVVFEFVGS